MDTLTCIAERRSVARLVDPAPDADQLRVLLEAAVAAPDHGQLRPWRFVVISGDARGRLGEVLAAAHAQREPSADVGALEKTAAKPFRAPMIVAIVCSPVNAADAWNGKHIPLSDQRAAAAAAAQNMCLAAHATGFGSIWRTGWFAEAPEVRDALGLRTAEEIVGWVYLGTVPHEQTLPPRRPTDLDGAVTTWA